MGRKATNLNDGTLSLEADLASFLPAWRIKRLPERIGADFVNRPWVTRTSPRELSWRRNFSLLLSARRPFPCSSSTLFYINHRCGLLFIFHGRGVRGALILSLPGWSCLPWRGNPRGYRGDKTSSPCMYGLILVYLPFFLELIFAFSVLTLNDYELEDRFKIQPSFAHASRDLRETLLKIFIIHNEFR
ncbi:hypothetical protein VNO77_20172 [Canavalia gladiata]|uniref:Uncharacterized protein n=1 Tax=Canavalia gladiata TaxID=3824 RepID=A0AAN9QM62_CANGL